MPFALPMVATVMDARPKDRSPLTLSQRDSGVPRAAGLSGQEPNHIGRYPIQRAKVQRPPLREETLARDRLLDWLSIQIHHRIVFVTADAGYGKTTLLADFSRRTRLRTIWYRLDAEDRSWNSLINYLVAAGRELDPTFAPRTFALLGEAAASRESTVKTFMDEFQSLVDPGAVLVFDDFHLVDDSPEARDVFRELLARAPERVTLVFIGRRAPSLRVARLRALGEVAELTTDDLRFNGSETERLFRESYQQPLEPDVLDDLFHRTEGWAASLQLVRAAIRDRSSGEIRNFVRTITGAEGDLYDYLAEEVVGDLPEDLQDFLMRTSLLDEVDANSGRLVTELATRECEALVAAAEGVGLLGRRAEGGRRGRAYHPLVREFLRQRLSRDKGPEFVRALHESIGRAAWPPDWRLACQHFSLAEMPIEVHRVLEAAVHEIMGGGQVTSADGFLRRHPPANPTANLEMLSSRSAFQEGRLGEALERARRAVALDPESDLASANLVSLRIMLGELVTGQAMAGSLAESSRDPVLQPIAQATHDMMLLSLDAKLGPFVTALLAMADRQGGAGHLHYRGVSLLNAATVLQAQGEAARCLTVARAAVEALEHTSSGQELISARLARAWALAHLGQWQEAEHELMELRALPAGSARAEALCEAAAIHLWYGSEGSARGLLAEAWAATEMRPDIGDIWRTAAMELAIRDRDWARADELERGLLLGELNPEPAHRARQLAMCAYSALAAEAPDADSILADAQALAYKQEAGFWAAYCRVLQACHGPATATFGPELLDATKLDRTYLSVLAEAVITKLADADDELLAEILSEVELRPQRWLAPLRNEVEKGDSPSRWMAARFLDRVGTREDVSRLRLLARSSKGTTTDKGLGKGLARRLAPAVRLEDLGRVQVVVDDRSVPGSDVRRKVLALACYLGSRPALSATRDQVLDVLWPDLEPSVGLNSLNQTIYFLRRVFEPDYEEELSPGYVRHDSNLIWLDPELVTTRSSECWELIRRIGAGRTDEVVRLSEAYVGKFALDFEYEEWAMPVRDALHASYLQIIESTVSGDMNAGFYSRGIALARRALEIDPHAEQLEVFLLRLYRNSGAHAAAAEQYAHYSSLLRTDLGVDAPPLEAI